MTNWYENTIKALQLNGKGERTQQGYARAVRMLSEFYAKDSRSHQRGRAPGVFPPPQKRQQVVAQYDAHLLLRDPLLL